jgi:hypothetical protein
VVPVGLTCRIAGKGMKGGVGGGGPEVWGREIARDTGRRRGTVKVRTDVLPLQLLEMYCIGSGRAEGGGLYTTKMRCVNGEKLPCTKGTASDAETS